MPDSRAVGLRGRENHLRSDEHRGVQGRFVALQPHPSLSARPSRFQTAKRMRKGTTLRRILGELLALMSVFFRCRFYFISSRTPAWESELGMTIKRSTLCPVKCNRNSSATLPESGTKPRNRLQGISGHRKDAGSEVASGLHPRVSPLCTRR